MRFCYWLVISSLCLTVALLQGCGPKVYTHGVPNYYVVRAGFARSGQPTTDEQWQWLKSQGYNHDIKLNFASEGSDDGATRAGMQVHELSMHPSGLDDMFVKPDTNVLREVQYLIALWANVPADQGGGVLIHCTNGWDRTGLNVGYERVCIEGWSKSQAHDEMLNFGFHESLYGLADYWEDESAPCWTGDSDAGA